MSQFWLRYISVEVGGESFTAQFTQGDPWELRIRFNITILANPTPAFCDVTITNPLPALAQQIASQQDEKIKLMIGYQGMSDQVVFSGTVPRSIYGRESPTDTVLKIHGVDGDHAYNDAYVNTTLQPGSTGMDVYQAVLQAMQKADQSVKGGGQGIQQGDHVTQKLQQLTFPSSQTLKGPARDYLTEVSQTEEVKALWHIDKGKLNVVGLTESKQTAVEVSYDTGLVGQPEQTFQGIMVRTLINPQIEINGLIHLSVAPMQAEWDFGDTSYTDFGIGATANAPTGRNYDIPSVALDGIYKVMQMNIFGDTYGNPWYMDLTCLAWGPSGVTGMTPSNLLGNLNFLETSS